ncbi:MAG: PTS sugar transporter subunit IIA, partial [Erysipelotrichaceae bacterium]|nr:PTS sugar transporter subunit IIA [Erysipelotrichaceae bacterium]
NDAITSLQQEKLLHSFRNVFPFFFKEENFEIIKGEHDKYSLIKRMCGRLEKNGYVAKDFEEKVIQREEAISTGYINFAVPHGVSNDVKEQTVAVCIAPDGVKWGEKIVDCVLLMAVDPRAINEFQDMYNALLLILMESDCVDRLKKVKSFTEFREIITTIQLGN